MQLADNGASPAANPCKPSGVRAHGPRGEMPDGVMHDDHRRGESPAASLVIATLLGREHEWFNTETGEIFDAPITAGFVVYPDGGVELWGVKASRRRRTDPEIPIQCENLLQPSGPTVQPKHPDRAEEGPDDGPTRSQQVSIRRARTRVRRMIRYYGLHLMVTLTFPGAGIHDYETALRYIQDFIHDHGRYLHLGGKWVAVPELHPGGHGWHWHVVVFKRFKRKELAALRTAWTDFLKRRGHLPSGGARYARIDLKDWGSPQKAAGYLAKYIGKSFEDDSRGKHRRRFLAALDMPVPSQRGGCATLEELRQLADRIGCRFVFESFEDPRWSGPPMVWASC